MTYDERIAKVTADAAALWGPEAQLRMLQEECGEVVVGVNHYLRSRTDAWHLAEEVADAIIMTGQARILLGSDVVDLAIERKLRRLELRIEAAQSKKEAGE